MTRYEDRNYEGYAPYMSDEEIKGRYRDIKDREFQRKVVKYLGPIVRYDLFINKRKAGTLHLRKRIPALMLAGFMLVSGGKWAISQIGGDKVVEGTPAIYATMDEAISSIADQTNYDFIPRFSVPYTVEYGDTIEGIISSYEEDTDLVYKYKDQIVRENGLRSANRIQAGQDITLYGVPADELHRFGYTNNYELFEPIREIKDRREFVNQSIGKIKPNNEQALAYTLISVKMADLESKYDDYRNATDPETKDYIEDELKHGYRDLCEDFASAFGVMFNGKCYPLGDALENNTSRTLG